LDEGNVTNKKSLASKLQKLLAVRSHGVLSRAVPTTDIPFISVEQFFYLIANWNSILNRNPLSGFADSVLHSESGCALFISFHDAASSRDTTESKVGKSPTKYCKDCERK
jgi:hypothetical protein